MLTKCLLFAYFKKTDTHKNKPERKLMWTAEHQLSPIIKQTHLISSVLKFGHSSRETLISKCVLNTGIKNGYLNDRKIYTFPIAVGLAISLLPPKMFLSGLRISGKRPFESANDHYHSEPLSADSFVVAPKTLSPGFIFNLPLTARSLCCRD